MRSADVSFADLQRLRRELAAKDFAKENIVNELKPNPAAVETATTNCTDITLQAEALKVIDAETLTLAGVMKEACQSLLKEIDGIFEKPKKATDAAHKEVVATWRGLRVPVEVAMTKIKAEIRTFHQAEKKRIADARRIEEEKQRKLEEERRIAAAIRAEEAGDTEKAEEIIEAPAPVLAKPLITAPPPTAKPKTIVMAEIYKAKVDNLFNFVSYAIEHPEFLYLLDVNQTKINSLAKKNKQLKDGDELLPGLTVVVEDQVR